MRSSHGMFPAGKEILHHLKISKIHQELEILIKELDKNTGKFS